VEGFNIHWGYFISHQTESEGFVVPVAQAKVWTIDILRVPFSPETGHTGRAFARRRR